MNLSKKNIRLLFLLYLVIIFSHQLFGQAKLLERVPLKFDAGNRESQLMEHYVKISPNDTYNTDKGYGWTIPPKYSFHQKELATTTMRDDLTIDGVTGKELEFKIDIPAGEWWFTFWMEAGNDYANTLKLFLNDKEKKIDWSLLMPGEAGPDKPMRIYRVFHTKVTFEEDGFKYRLVGGKDSVRICGFTFIPNAKPETLEHLYVASLVKGAGQYRSKTSLPDVHKFLSELVDQNPTDANFSYWQQQVNLLREGERITEMMGWEWARQVTHLSIFDRLKQAITIFDGLIENNNSDNSSFSEKAVWYRGKIFYDLFLESGGSSRDQTAKSDLAKLYKIYPEDPTLAMLNGEKIDFPDPADNMVVTENAPKWSVLQRELYNRLSNEIDWWVNVRQAANGEFGGKIGDDVELLRWWSSFLLTGNKTAIRGWRKLADAVWYNPKVYKGYSKKIYDVEHAAEFISDSTPELILIDNDSTYFNRLYFTAEYFENLWTSVNKKGHRFFKSAWYSSTKVDETPPRNIDVDYNSRAVKPLRYLAWATRDEHFINLLQEWSLAWVDAAMTSAKGKPKGILPSSIRGYDEAFNGDGSNWYEADTFWSYFNWHHSVGSKILDNIMFTYTLTSNEYLLQPINITMQMIKDFTDQHPDVIKIKYEKGSKGWVVRNMIKNYGFWNVIEKWRIFTGNSDYDELLEKYGNDYTRFKLTGDVTHLERNLENTLEEIRYNTPLRTSLVLHTDRVRTHGANTLKAMLTGDGTPEASSPYYAVTWENADRDFTALVGNYSKKNLSAQLFSHSEKAYKLTARFWLLEKGMYNFVVSNSDGDILSRQNFKLENAGERLSFELPANQLVTIRVDELK
jgi:hypothetical protein